MKKIATLAVLAAAASVSYAQSSVTLFGIADATVQVGRGSTDNNVGLGSGGLSTSRIGFRGVEDLGGGLKAGFWLEAGYTLNNGNGQNSNALAFTRRSTVSLMGDSWGEIRLGRDFTAPYNNLYDAFGDNGVGNILETRDLGLNYGLQTRTSNAVSYFTPKTLGGFFGQVQYYRNGQGVATGDTYGNGYGVRVGYENGPVSVGVAYGKTDYQASATNLAKIDSKSINLGGSYDFGVAKLLLSIGQDEGDGAGLDAKTRLYTVGTTVPVGAGLIRASWTRADQRDSEVRADKFAIGYVHNLSKRTALYTTFAYLKNKDASSLALNGSTTGLGDSSKGLDIGLRHAF
ncbi:porin [Pseudorhodoferax sp. LjRoot39]|uniref:porin n=1 Tax=Pseudorhodoferax sp. LjRoot39 TaxID=3342328 RepID=UPI003ECEBE40